MPGSGSRTSAGGCRVKAARTRAPAALPLRFRRGVRAPFGDDMSDDTTSLFAAVPQVPGRRALGESSASFLARGGRRECIAIREWLEGAYARVPLARTRDVWNCIHSHRGFLGAYFELRMLALLEAIGCEVAWEPAIGGAYVPDFAAAHATGGFIMEATVCGQFNADDHANEERAVAAIHSRVREVIGPPLFEKAVKRPAGAATSSGRKGIRWTEGAGAACQPVAPPPARRESVTHAESVPAGHHWRAGLPLAARLVACGPSSPEPLRSEGYSQFEMLRQCGPRDCRPSCDSIHREVAPAFAARDR